MMLKFRRFSLDLDDDLAWLEPYVRLAKRLGIPISRLKAIRGYYIPKNRMERQSAQCEEKDGEYIISILKRIQIYSSESVSE